MFREDYLLRLIRQVAEALGRVLRLRDEGRAAEADRSLEDAAQQLLGMPLSVVRAVDDATVVAMMSRADGPDLARLYAAVRLLRVSAVEGDVQRSLSLAAACLAQADDEALARVGLTREAWTAEPVG